MKQAEIGLIGLAVMGANLARNIADKGFPIVVYNRSTERMEKFIREFGNKKLSGEKDLKNFIKKIKRPRKIIILVKAGPAVDAVISQLIPHLDKNDMIIDCGNSNFRDSQRRFKELKGKNIEFIGCGISGGEEGALKGPSMMPGGTKKSWNSTKKIFQKIAAKDFSGNPCVSHIGSDGAGHYVKMVHNGIEYGVMQIIAEAYEILRTVYKLPAPKIAEIFAQYNRGKLHSYLFEISADVLNKKDEFKKGYLIDQILDKAGQKGTGRWTAIDAIDRGVSLPSISEAVFARINSGEKELRKKLSKTFKTPGKKADISLSKFTKILENAIYAGMLISYAQGYDLIQKAANEEKWKISLAEISRIWEGGCIIRAKILNDLHKGFQKQKNNTHLFEIKSLQNPLKKSIPDLRKIVAFSAEHGSPIPSLASALAYFDSMCSENLSANMIQGLRDYFGAHTYERKDRKGIFHSDWQ